VHHEVWHNTENRRREAHLELAKSLRDELFQARELIFIDDLLCDAVEEVGHVMTIFTYSGPIALITIGRNTMSMTWQS
jgi:hypothetical protein